MNEILSHLFRRRLRTLLTLFAIGVGIFALTVVGSLSEFMNEMITGNERASESRISIWPEDWEHPINESTLRQLRRVPGVAGSLRSLYGRLDPDDDEASFSGPDYFYGTTSDMPGMEFFHLSRADMSLREGRFPAPGSQHEAIAGYEITQKRGWQVGQAIIFQSRTFTLVGIWERVPNDPAYFVQISYEAARRILNDPWYFGNLTVVVAPGADPDEVAQNILDQVDGVNLRLPSERREENRRSMILFNLIFAALAALAILVGGLTIVNTMVMAVTERSREIGLKKALGATDGDVLAEVVIEAGIIGGLGGGLGVLTGWGATHLTNAIMDAAVGLSIFKTTPRLAVAGVVFTVLLGMVAGLYPAWRASRLDPVQALRGSLGAEPGRRALLRRLVHLLRSHGRALLTVGGVAVGVFALTVIGSLSEYLNGMLKEAETGAADRIAVYESRSASFSQSAIRRTVERVEGVRGMVISAWGGTLEEQASEDALAETFFGIDSPTGELDFDNPFSTRLWAGRWLWPGSLTETVVGYDLAQGRGLTIGSLLIIRDREFTVVGILERQPNNLIAGTFNSRAFVSMDAWAALLGQPSGLAGSITALIAPGQDAGIVARRIREALPGIRTYTARQGYEEMRQALTIFFLILSASGILAIVVGGLSVINTMVMVVSERTREIGLKKAVGAGDPDILAEVVVDAGIVGGLGGLTGLSLGWGTVRLINAITEHLENLHVLLVTPRLAVGAIVLTVLLGMFAGLYPAWRASRLDPVVALRTE
ncbi:MAG: FtsX-like permease family protein [Chloroflexota bacterium]